MPVAYGLLGVAEALVAARRSMRRSPQGRGETTDRKLQTGRRQGVPVRSGAVWCGHERPLMRQRTTAHGVHTSYVANQVATKRRRGGRLVRGGPGHAMRCSPPMLVGGSRGTC